LEIKTCTPGAHRVTIASLQQLDAGEAPLFLSVLWLAAANPNVEDGFSVAHLVALLRTMIESSPLASTEFAFRLAEAGYADCEEYEGIWFRVAQVRNFRVSNDFPRLLRPQAPSGITDATYGLDLGACGTYECQI
jgi:hypothetical protein